MRYEASEEERKYLENYDISMYDRPSMPVRLFPKLDTMRWQSKNLPAYSCNFGHLCYRKTIPKAYILEFSQILLKDFQYKEEPPWKIL